MQVELGLRYLVENWQVLLAVGGVGLSAAIFGFAWWSSTFGDSGTESHQVIHF